VPGANFAAVSGRGGHSASMSMFATAFDAGPRWQAAVSARSAPLAAHAARQSAAPTARRLANVRSFLIDCIVLICVFSK